MGGSSGVRTWRRVRSGSVGDRREPSRRVGDVVVGEMGVDGQLDTHLGRLGLHRDARLELGHGLGDQLDVEIEAVV